MPLVAWLTLSYLGGLLAGFSDAARPAGILLVAIGIAALASGRARLAAGLTLGVAGLIAATAAGDARRECVRQTMRHRSSDLRIAAEASPGSFTRAEVSGCGAPVTLFVGSGHAGGGSIVRATGDISV